MHLPRKKFHIGGQRILAEFSRFYRKLGLNFFLSLNLNMFFSDMSVLCGSLWVSLINCSQRVEDEVKEETKQRLVVNSEDQ